MGISINSEMSSHSSSSSSSGGDEDGDVYYDEKAELFQTGLKWTLKKYITAWWEKQISATLCMDLVK